MGYARVYGHTTTAMHDTEYTHPDGKIFFGQNMLLVRTEASFGIDYFVFLFLILRRMGKNKARAPTLPRIRYMCANLIRRSRCNSSSHYVATGRVGMSTRPGPERSGAVKTATPSSPGSVGLLRLARAHPLTKTRAMEPSHQTRSSYGPPYPLGRVVR